MPLRTIAWVSILVGVGGVGATTYHVAQLPNASDNNRKGYNAGWGLGFSKAGSAKSPRMFAVLSASSTSVP